MTRQNAGYSPLQEVSVERMHIPKHRSRAMWRQAKKFVKVVCQKCGTSNNIKYGVFRKYHSDGNYTCYKCHKKGKDELAEAMLNIAKKKHSMKARK